MQIIPLSSIQVRKRQRSEIPESHLKGLRESILNVGLLHAPVAWLDNVADVPVWVLTTGECRFRTIERLAKEKIAFNFGDQRIEPGFCPIVPLKEAVESLAFEAELDENVRRLDLTWQDRARAYADLHTMRLAQNPKHTLADTKAELVELRAPSLATGAPMTTANTNSKELREALTIAEHLGNEAVQKARNPSEAMQIILRQEEAKINAALIARSLREKPTASNFNLIHGDLEDELPKIADGTVDLTIADPPYGISASTGGFRQRAAVHHNYEDTPELAKRLLQTILTEAFRYSKPMANIFVFGDIDNFPFFKTTAANLGWVPFRRPLIWQKSPSEGMAPWGGSGPRITTEFLFYATKGQRGMIASPIDVFDDRRVPRNIRIHGAEKPVDLMKKLIECTTMPGDLVLDPCMGSGSSIVACRELRRSGIGIEKSREYFDHAYSNVHSDELKEPSNDEEKNS